MKRIFTIILVSLSASSFGQWVSSSEIESIAKSEMKSAMGREGRVATLSDSVDVVFHDVFWRIVPGDTSIEGIVKTDFVVTAGQINSLYFDLSDLLVVDSVMYHSTNLVYSRPGNDVLKIDLPNSLSSGTLDSVAVIYHGSPPLGGGYHMGKHYGIPVTWTLSEPYGASDWWPCKDGLNDKIDSMNISVSTTIGNKVGSLGLLEQIDTIGTDVVYHWKHRHPVVPYLVSIAVTNYVEFNVSVTSGTETFDVQNYVYPEDSVLASWSVSRIPATFNVFDSLFIPYPFRNEKYGHAQSEIGGGMEHQTMSTMGSWSDDLISHELAHQWFGDYITCGSWSELWLNEGFATYLTGIANEFVQPQNWNGWKQSKINSVTSQPNGSVFVTDTTNFWRLFSSRLTYDKGSMLLHMLRWKCGDAAFFQGIQNYLNDPLVSNGFAKTSDLQGHLETASGLDLDEFFEDWYYGEGYPTYSVLVEGLAPNYAVNLKQVTSHSSVDFFEMPVEIQLFSDNGDTTIVVDNTMDDQWFSFEYSEKIKFVRLDPNKWLVMGSPQVVLGNDDIEWSKKQPVIFPVPANNQATINNISVDLNVSEIKVHGIMGNTVNVLINSGNGFLTIDISQLAQGVYFVNHPTWEKPLRLVKN